MKRVKDEVKTRKIVTNVKGLDIEFDEYYKVDPDTGEELFDRDLEIENDIRVYDIYKKEMNLLTSEDIKNIRNKYSMSQKEFALSLGVGEVTIHRFENGSIQTEAVDSIIRLSEDPNIMYSLLLKNKDSLDNEYYNIFINRINRMMDLKKHRIADFNINDFLNINFKTEDVNNVCLELIMDYNSQIDKISEEYGIKDKCNEAEYITPLKIQKLLYYIQGLSLFIYNKPAFLSPISAWQYGPVVEEIYKKYNGRNPIYLKNSDIKVSDGLKKIINLVINSYGQIEANRLISLTHEEDPWINSINSETKKISIDMIRNYFIEVYK